MCPVCLRLSLRQNKVCSKCGCYLADETLIVPQIDRRVFIEAFFVGFLFVGMILVWLFGQMPFYWKLLLMILAGLFMVYSARFSCKKIFEHLQRTDAQLIMIKRKLFPPGWLDYGISVYEVKFRTHDYKAYFRYC